VEDLIWTTNATTNIVQRVNIAFSLKLAARGYFDVHGLQYSTYVTRVTGLIDTALCSVNKRWELAINPVIKANEII